MSIENGTVAKNRLSARQNFQLTSMLAGMSQEIADRHLTVEEVRLIVSPKLGFAVTTYNVRTAARAAGINWFAQGRRHAENGGGITDRLDAIDAKLDRILASLNKDAEPAA